jgi:hypothetical protein
MMQFMRPSTLRAADCPAAPPTRRTTYARTMHSACLVVGGVDKLAAHLGAPEAQVREWVEGEIAPPHDMFLAAVELILLHLDTQGRAT